MKKAVWWVVGLAVVAGLGALLFVRIQAAREAKAEVAPAEVPETPVVVAALERRDLVERVTVTGTIRPGNEVDILAKVPGRLEKVLVGVGDTVKAGAVLAVVEHRMLALQESQAKAAVDAAAAGLEAAKVQLETARLGYERVKGLVADKAMPAAELEKVEAAMKGAESGVRAAEAQLSMAKAAAALAAEAVRNATITSPIAGTVTKRMVDVGTEAMPGRPLFQVQDVGALELEGAVVAEEFVRLTLGAPARVTVDDLRGVAFTGKVATLSPTLDPMTRRAAVEVAVDNPEGKLLPNMFARASVDVGTRKDTLCVPAAAVLALPSGTVVYVVREGKAKIVKPVLGIGDGEWIAVESGIAAGDKVIVTGHAGLADGASVKVADAAKGETALKDGAK